jgi:RNA polymerase primary sigma factor
MGQGSEGATEEVEKAGQSTVPRLLPRLSAEEEIALAMRIEAHDMAAKCMVVEGNMHLVEPVAKRYVGRGLPLAELIQDGSLGLLRAVETYDYRKGAGFSAFARRSIRQAITHALADQDRTIRVPRHVIDTLSALQRVQRAVTLGPEREPTLEEGVIGQGETPDGEREAPRAGSAPMSRETGLADTGAWQLDDLIEDEQAMDLLEAVGESLQAEELHEVLSALTPRERKVVEQRFGLRGARPRTLDEIGKTFGLSRPRIRRIETKALVALRSCRDSQRLREFLR